MIHMVRMLLRFAIVMGVVIRCRSMRHMRMVTVRALLLRGCVLIVRLSGLLNRRMTSCKPERMGARRGDVKHRRKSEKDQQKRFHTIIIGCQSWFWLLA